jgi:hypothetical protein
MAKKKQDEIIEMPFRKENYKLMAIGFGIIVLGFILMVGGKSPDPAEFNPEIFSFRRITLAPMLVLFGYCFQVYAILKKPKEKTNHV